MNSSIFTEIAQRPAPLESYLKRNEESSSRVTELIKETIRIQRQGKEWEQGFANVIFDSIIDRIRDFQSGLDTAHEVGATLASFGGTVTIRVTAVEFIDPFLIIFAGETTDGAPAELIQHVTQVNFLLLALPKPTEQQEPRRIGFHP